MKPGLHRGTGVLGEEIRRGLQRDRFHAALDEFLIPRQGREPTGLVHPQFIAALVGDFLEIIRHGMQLIAAMLLEKPGDPGTATAIADNAQFDLSLELRRLGSGGGSSAARPENAANDAAEVATLKAPPRNWRRFTFSLVVKSGRLIFDL